MNLDPYQMTSMLGQLGDNREFDLQSLSQVANPDADPAMFQELLNRTSPDVAPMVEEEIDEDME
tara:strand:+ start:704 stop:895 length:192 start_codon:yes stop_codon:yes gene_type:complete